MSWFTGLTKAERLMGLLTALSVVFTAAWPLATYFWLVPGLRDYELRGRLQATGKFIEDAGDDKNPLKYELTILNFGRLPAKEIHLDAVYSPGYSEGGEIRVYPPIQSDAKEGDSSHLVLKTPLAPNERILVQFFAPPVDIYISTETGDTSAIHTDLQTNPKYRKYLRFPSLPQDKGAPPRR